jgi:hypothetical protein
VKTDFRTLASEAAGIGGLSKTGAIIDNGGMR